jgi:hypothetical protein
MTDIVERLREYALLGYLPVEVAEGLPEAANEIERLQAELKTTRNTALINLKVAKDRADEIERLRRSVEIYLAEITRLKAET